MVSMLAWMLTIKSMADTLKTSARQAINNLPETGFVATGGEGRVNKALELYNLDIFNKLYISGASSSLENILEETGYGGADKAFKDSIVLGNAQSTRENAKEIADWIEEKILKNDFKEATIITSDYHVKRLRKDLENEINHRRDLGSFIHPEKDYNVRLVFLAVGGHLRQNQCYSWNSGKAIINEWWQLKAAAP